MQSLRTDGNDIAACNHTGSINTCHRIAPVLFRDQRSFLLKVGSVMSTARHSAADGCGQFSEAIVVQACESLNIAIGENHELRCQLAEGKGNLRAGSSSAGLVSRGFKIFKGYKFADPHDANIARHMTHKQYNRLLDTWKQRFFRDGPTACKRVRKPSAGLNKKEKKELCRLLSTPVQSESGDRAWRSISDALSAHPRKERIAELVTQSGMSHEKLTADLIATGRLSRKFADKAPAFCPRTRKGREDCAAVWRSAKPWLGVQPGKVAQPWRDEFEAAGFEKIFLKEPWPEYQEFTYMIDAASKSDQEGPSHKKEKALFDPLNIHRPEVTRPDVSGTNSKKVMWYIVIHKILGLVLGPDFMYTGSSPTTTPQQRNAAKAAGLAHAERHAPSFPDWCVLHLSDTCSVVHHHA